MKPIDKKCKVHDSNCCGKIEIHDFGGKFVSLCRYHGALLEKLMMLDINEIESIFKTLQQNQEEWKKVCDRTNIAALCLSDEEWKEHFLSVYDGSYDYRNR